MRRDRTEQIRFFFITFPLPLPHVFTFFTVPFHPQCSDSVLVFYKKMIFAVYTVLFIWYFLMKSTSTFLLFHLLISTFWHYSLFSLKQCHHPRNICCGVNLTALGFTRGKIQNINRNFVENPGILLTCFFPLKFILLHMEKWLKLKSEASL